jgi:solute carrier family 25 carnitine/acylcarnitine transporter 20/29
MEPSITPFEIPSERANPPSAVKELAVGAAGGITQVLIGMYLSQRLIGHTKKPGQPFDIVKVRMQTQANQNAIQVAQNILRREGALAFYKVLHFQSMTSLHQF